MNDEIINKIANFIIEAGTNHNNKEDFFKLMDEQLNKYKINKKNRSLVTIKVVKLISKIYVIDSTTPFHLYIP